MNIKSLLLGSAAASMVAVSGAQAADPIVYIEPEPMEYVRICDIYGAGFYYIPGTETCLKIGGHVRFQVTHTGARPNYSFGVTQAQGREFLQEGFRTAPFAGYTNPPTAIPAAAGVVSGDGFWVSAAGTGPAPAAFVWNRNMTAAAWQTQALNLVPAGGIELTRRGSAADYREYSSLSRAQLDFDARSETEWGTLQGFIRLVGTYTSGSGNAPGSYTTVYAPAATVGSYVFGPEGNMGPWGATPSTAGGGSGGTMAIDHAYIQLGGLRMGKTDTIYARELGYGAGGVYGATYGFENDNEVSYVFKNAGFTVGASMVENHDGTWAPDFQGVVNYQFGGNSIGGGVAYDNVNNRFAAKGVARFAIPNIGGSVGAHVFYSEGPWFGTAAYNRYAIVSPATGLISDWSALVHASVPVAEGLSVKGHAQWFNERVTADTWRFVGGLNWEPVAGLTIQPEVQYTTNVRTTEFAVRFQRNF